MPQSSVGYGQETAIACRAGVIAMVQIIASFACVLRGNTCNKELAANCVKTTPLQ